MVRVLSYHNERRGRAWSDLPRPMASDARNIAI